MPANIIHSTRINFEEYFKDAVLSSCPSEIIGLRDAVSYHFGWDGSITVPGKRLRPLFLILVYASLGGNPEDAFQAASALEVLHNFTLIHDDIIDKGETRHGHPALWKQTGIPLAINVGDYLASLSQSLMGSQPAIFPLEIQKRALNEFHDATLGVIQGQQLDIQYENKDRISIEEYLGMIRLKTARLFSAAFGIGSYLAGSDRGYAEGLKQAGCDIGLGFQIQDDYLGVWGSSEKTGKSTSTDLFNRKKTFPAMTGLKNSEIFRELWAQDNQSDPDLLEKMKGYLNRAAIREDTLNQARAYYIDAQTGLNQLLPVENDYARALLALVTSTFAPALTGS